MIPNVLGSMPVRNCQNGSVSPAVSASDAGGAGGGTKGVQMATCTKNAPTAMTNTHTDTLIKTSCW